MQRSLPNSIRKQNNNKQFSVGRNVQRLGSEDILTNNLPTSARQLLEKYCVFMCIKERIFQISLGVSLGDCSLQKNKREKREKYRLKFLQGEKHNTYILHLHQEFKEYVISPPFHNIKRKTYSFQKLFQESFKEFANIFYNEKSEKIVSSSFVENKTSPISLAYWFMNDGGLLSYNKDYRRKGLVFNTHGFSFQEVNILSQNSFNASHLKTWVKENKKKPVIAVSGKGYSKIPANNLSPYLGVGEIQIAGKG